MAGRLIVVSGTGTGIGKTYLCEALLTALRASGRQVVGIKPVETGLNEPGPSDALRLDRASSFHVKQSARKVPRDRLATVVLADSTQSLRLCFT